MVPFSSAVEEDRGSVSFCKFFFFAVYTLVLMKRGGNVMRGVGGDRRGRSVRGAAFFLAVRDPCRYHDGTECASSRGSVRGYLWAQGMHWVDCIDMEVRGVERDGGRGIDRGEKWVLRWMWTGCSRQGWERSVVRDIGRDEIDG